MYNQHMLPVVATREAFEARLRSMAGLEYIVAQEPAETAPGTGTGVWVIRKQTRRKRPGEEDQITVHATYFVVGENVYMAPNIGDIVGNRLLTIIQSLNKAYSTAAALPSFTPALGHTYLPPPKTDRQKAADAQLLASKASTPMPDSAPPKKKSSLQTTSVNSILGNRLLAESFEMALRYGEEYIDENPITGHPGDFHFSSTGRATKPILPPSKATTQSQAKAPVPPTPEVKPAEAPRKASKGDKSPKVPAKPKPKRRKSQGPISATPK
jgi:mediator of RNA polymerase II transcription subunit 6